ncbi:MAG: hypothetical protein IT372_00700 [Polyangiaceae bacterium]|nr:hypothetical protein [Polyangiaceae bacterium]
MATTLAALLFRPAEVPDAALSRGFAVALAGWDVPAPRLTLAALPGAPGWSAAFYSSGQRPGEDELEHVIELFEDELSPAVGVLDAAAELGAPGAAVLSLVYSEELVHDDGWRIDARGFERHFVREGDEGIERGVETPDSSEVAGVKIDCPEGASEAEEQAAEDRAVRPHRGSTFLSAALGTPALPALMGALFAADRRLEVRLVDPSPGSIESETRRLNRVLGRVDGRGASTPPASIAGVRTPPVYEAFARVYDWADPKDPGDLYRELSIGAIEGTLHFMRDRDLEELSADPGWAIAAKAGHYPLARLLGSAVGGARPGGTIAIGPDGDRLWLLRPGGEPRIAGPALGELLRYLSLGWSRRTDAEEDLIGALMLRARIRRGDL